MNDTDSESALSSLRLPIVKSAYALNENALPIAVDPGDAHDGLHAAPDADDARLV